MQETHMFKITAAQWKLINDLRVQGFKEGGSRQLRDGVVITMSKSVMGQPSTRFDIMPNGQQKKVERTT